MIDVKEFIYNELINNTDLSGYIGGRIFPQVAPLSTDFPLIVYNRITPGAIDLKGIRNEYFQISTWGKSIKDNEHIMSVIISVFNGLKKAPVKFCDIRGINETFDKETGTFGNHVTVHIKLFETSES